MAMFRKRKFDIAISVAEEDITVAEQIAAALRDRNIIPYLYTERENLVENLGKHLLRISLDKFGAQARYVLFIVSQYTQTAYWSRIEHKIASIYKSHKNGYILPLQIGSAPMHYIGDDIVYAQWKNDPEDIADLLKECLHKRKTDKIKIWINVCKLVTLFLVLALIILSGMYISSLPPYSTRKHNGIFIPAGAFTMGTNAGCNDEKPEHSVNLHSFCISQVEVTVNQYEKYCRNKNKALPRQPKRRTNGEYGNYPVVNVTWQEAADYCAWVGGRLPTEAEWEYATNLGRTFKYSGGNNAKQVALYGMSNASNVGNRRPNALGLYDMTGNVAEWCFDWYDSTSYSKMACDNPPGPDKGKEKVVRGGSYKDSTVDKLLITHRSKELPGSRRPDVGFRVVWDE
jgi:hypothetical protein